MAMNWLFGQIASQSLQLEVRPAGGCLSTLASGLWRERFDQLLNRGEGVLGLNPSNTSERGDILGGGWDIPLEVQEWFRLTRTHATSLAVPLARSSREPR